MSWHVIVDALLVPVALTKTASTSWRFLRHHRRSTPYRVPGPPPAVLRVLGRVVRAFGILTGREARTAGRPDPVPGGGRRGLVLAVALAAGAVVAFLLLPSADDGHHDGGPERLPARISGLQR